MKPRAILTGKSRVPGAFTLPEVMVTLAISLLITSAVVVSQLFGAQMTQLTQAKIHTSDRARQLMRLLTADIQRARLIQVGTGSQTSFVPAVTDAAQQGNALQIQPSENPGVFIRYFRSAADSKLKRVQSDGSLADLAGSVSNVVVFTLEGFQGTVLTQAQAKAVIGVDLEFTRLENPDLPVGPGHHYKSYRFHTRIAQPTL
jgi:prepilin-type N-terminal cleavage/methylation domain-containing protein